MHPFSGPAFPELELNLWCCLLSHTHRCSHFSFATDPCAKGAQGRSTAFDKLFLYSCALHVLSVALTVSTILRTGDTPPVQAFF